jgi:hypothetical protein
MDKLNTKAVAAAILLHEDCALHVVTLTSLVLESKLTTLGLRGPTPRNSLSSILNKESSYFSPSWLRAYYEIAGNEVAGFPDVKTAIRRYEEFLKKREDEMTIDQMIASLKAQLEKEKRRHQELVGKLKQISQICLLGTE